MCVFCDIRFPRGHFALLKFRTSNPIRVFEVSSRPSGQVHGEGDSPLARPDRPPKVACLGPGEGAVRDAARALRSSSHTIRATVSLMTRRKASAAPKDLVPRTNVIAAGHDMSVSALFTATLSQTSGQEERYAEARDGMLADLEHGYDLGTQGATTWTRDSLHER